jgi:cytochrome P450
MRVSAAILDYCQGLSIIQFVGTPMDKSLTSSKVSPERRSFSVEHGHRFGGCLGRMRTDPLAHYMRMRRERGDYVRMRIIPGFDCYVLTHPDAVEHVLLKAHKNYRKPDIFYKAVSLLVGNGLFTNEGEGWMNQRRLAQPAFHGQYLLQLAPLMVAAAEQFAQEAAPLAGRPIDISAGMMKVGLRISSMTLLSADISGDTDAIGKAFRTAFAHVSNRLNSLQLVPNWFPTKSNRNFRAAKRLLDQAVMEVIESRRRKENRPRDLLTMLLSAYEDEPVGATPARQLMDEVLTLLAGGHENIGAALAWTWYLLAKHPEVQENLFDEIHGRLGGRNPTADDLPHLPLLSAVFEESLRIYPPGWGELRESISADEIEGHAIPRKATIILCQWVTHRHPDFWDEPDEFRPERFLNAAAASRHRFAYFPFGGGPRICIGLQFAMIEGPLVIATILQRFRVELVPNHPVELDATFTLRPRNGVKVLLHPR